MSKQESSRYFPSTSTPISLAKGLLLQAGGTHFQIADFGNGKVVLQALDTQQKKLIDERALLDEMFRGTVVPLINNAHGINSDFLSEQVRTELRARHASEASIRDMVAKAQWIRELQQSGFMRITDDPEVRIAASRLAAGKLKDTPRFTLSTLAAAQRTLQKHRGDVLSLLPRYAHRGGSGKSRLSATVDCLIEDEIGTQRGYGKPLIKRRVAEAVSERVRELNKGQPVSTIACPSESTIVRRLNQIVPAYDQAVLRHGRETANRIFRENGARLTADRPLEVAEIDDKDTGVFLIDKRHMLPCGRAYLTSQIDQFDAVPLGFDLGHQHRSTESAINCILDGLLPKDPTRPEFIGQPNPWIGYGTPGINILDNATYNHAGEVERTIFNLQGTFGWAKPHAPTEKSSIEHFNFMVEHDFGIQLNGWIGEEDNPHGAKRGLEAAIYDIHEYSRMWVGWVTGQYLNRPGMDGLTPTQRRMAFYRDHHPMVRWSRDEIELLRMTTTQLTLRASGGVLWLQLRYRSDQLAELRRQLGCDAKVTVLTSRHQLLYIYVVHPITKTPFKVPCIEDRRYLEGLTCRMQKLILAQARRMKMNNPDLHQCVKARNALATDTQKLSADRKMRNRQKAVNNRVSPVPEDVGATGKSEPRKSEKFKEVFISDLEHTVNQLDEIDLSEMDWAQGEEAAQ